jgi:hypothetical protein
MNLTYRGIAFEAPIAGTEAMVLGDRSLTIETEQTGTFRGNNYKMKQARTVQRQSETELTYRGVRYAR